MCSFDLEAPKGKLTQAYSYVVGLLLYFRSFVLSKGEIFQHFAPTTPCESMKAFIIKDLINKIFALDTYKVQGGSHLFTHGVSRQVNNAHFATASVFKCK